MDDDSRDDSRTAVRKWVLHSFQDPHLLLRDLARLKCLSSNGLDALLATLPTRGRFASCALEMSFFHHRIHNLIRVRVSSVFLLCRGMYLFIVYLGGNDERLHTWAVVAFRPSWCCQHYQSYIHI